MKTLPLRTLALSLALLAAAGTEVPVRAGLVYEGDPVPNLASPPTGGISYTWVAFLGGKDQVQMEGSVGAWSWDDGGAFAPSGQGWTHTSNWVALSLNEESRLTVRLEKRAGSTLHPAITIYQGWQDSGEDSHIYANRSDISWAPDTKYLVHFAEAPGNNAIEGTILLPAGKYSIALGGNSDAGGSPMAPQAYTATLSSKVPHNPADVTLTKTRFTTRKTSFGLKGTVVNPPSLDAVEVRFSGRNLDARVSGASWAAKLRGLKVGLNLATVRARSLDGSVGRAKVVLIRRKTAKKKVVRQPSAHRLGWVMRPN